MQPRLTRALPALAFALAIFVAILAGCSGGDNGTAPSPAPVTGPNFSFAFPATGTVANPGTSNRRFFTRDEAGTWTYRCIPHGSAGMTGTIIVDPASTIDSALVQVGPGNSLSFSPSTVTIDTSGYVRWINVSSMNNHTVTRP
jgi:plastocyanin